MIKIAARGYQGGDSTDVQSVNYKQVIFARNIKNGAVITLPAYYCPGHT